MVQAPFLDVVSKTNDRIVLRFNNVPRQYVNAIRRISISEVPTLAIDDVVMMENSSVMHDEAIAHRLGLIPLRTDLNRFVLPQECDCNNSLGCSKCRVLLVLDSEANDKTKLVTSGELVSEDDVVRPVSSGIPIIILAPSQKLKFEAYARLGLGSNHAKWRADYMLNSHRRDRTKSINIDCRNYGGAYRGRNNRCGYPEVDFEGKGFYRYCRVLACSLQNLSEYIYLGIQKVTLQD